MPTVAILYIALGRYTVFWDEFYASAERNLINADKHYFIWTDNVTDAMRRPNITIIPAKKMGWPYDSMMRFAMFSDRADELAKFDFVFFFNANFMFYNPTDLTEIAPRPWNEGLVAGQHPGVLTGDVSDPDKLPYERRPESTAYIPYGDGKYYVCGAFNGGTGPAFIQMCKTLAKNVQTDLDNGINAIVDDESHLNAYMYDKNFLLAGVAYGFPERHLKRLRHRQRTMVKIISRDKNHPRFGGTQYLRGTTDRRNSRLLHPVMKTLFRVASGFCPNQATRKKIRSYYG